MTTPEPFWWDDNDNISQCVSSFMRPHGDEATRSAYDLALEIAFAYRIRIAELEAQVAASKPRPEGSRMSYTGVRGGLLKGRVRMKGVREPNKLRPTFDAALSMATTDDLMYALELLIEHPNARRTWRDYRIKHIDKRIREITGMP